MYMYLGLGTFENENFLCCTEADTVDGERAGEYGVLGDAG